MDRFNTNYFFSYLNKHIKKIKTDAEIVAEKKYVDYMEFKNTFHLSDTKAFDSIKELVDFKVIQCKIFNNQLIIEILNKKNFINYICNSRRFETQVMYLNLYGKVTVKTLQEIFNLSPLNAQILYNNLLTREDCLKKISSQYYAINNIEKTITQIGQSMNVFYRERFAV